MWTVSAIQMHPKGLIVCDEDATLELHVKVNCRDLLCSTMVKLTSHLDREIF